MCVAASLYIRMCYKFVCKLVLKRAILSFPGISAIEVTVVYSAALSSAVCMSVSVCFSQGFRQVLSLLTACLRSQNNKSVRFCLSGLIVPQTSLPYQRSLERSVCKCSGVPNCLVPVKL